MYNGIAIPAKKLRATKASRCDRHIDVEILGNACSTPPKKLRGKAGEMTASAGVGLGVVCVHGSMFEDPTRRRVSGMTPTRS